MVILNYNSHYLTCCTTSPPELFVPGWCM